MEWISVKECGLPKPDRDKTYLVSTRYGYGIGSYENQTLQWNEKTEKYEKGIFEPKWFLNFDFYYSEEEIDFYMLIEEPPHNECIVVR